MDVTIQTTLRLLHIISGMLWVGYGTLAAWIVHPAAQSLGERGDQMLQTFYAHSRYNKIMPLTAIITTVAGLVLWTLVTVPGEGMDLRQFSPTGDMVMAFGALVGLLAFGHSAGATGRFSAKYAKAVREDGDDVTISEARQKLFLHANISAILTIIAAVAMSGAQYV